MARTPGITIEKDTHGHARYARIDLRKHGNNELIEDFLDGQLAESRRGDETIPWNEVKIELDKKHGIK